MNTDTEHKRATALGRLMSAANRTTRRLVLGRLLGGLSLTLPVPLIYAAGALTWIKVAHPDAATERLLVWGGALALIVPLAGLVRSLLRRRPSLWGAQVLDRYHGLAGRVSNALSFQRQAKRTPLMDAAIDDALSVVSDLSPRRAAPIQVPRGFWVSVGLAASVTLLSQLEVRTQRFVPAVVDNFEPLELPADDVELLRQLAEEMQDKAEDPAALAAMRRFNQLIEDIAERRLDRQEVFRRLEQLERGLLNEEALSDADLDEALADVGRELSRSTLSKPTAEALEQKNLPDAEEALKQLAKRLREKPETINKAELERLRKALSAASEKSNERLSRIEEQRRSLLAQQKRLLKKKEKGERLSAQEQRELERSKRQLKRLDRQKQRAKGAQSEMSKLDRELAEAARKLQEEMGGAAENLERGAEDINRMQKKQLSDKEKKALKKQLEELRQMLRQNKGDNQKRKEMLERFRRMARGQGGNKPAGKSGSGESGKKQGKGQGKEGPGRLSLGMGQTTIEVPVEGQAQSGSPGQGNSSGAGDEKGVGTGAGPNVAGEKGKQLDTVDVSAAGIDSGEGAASSEVVFGAAERGFAGSGYENIYTDYKTVAEEVMESDEIPPGYKFYVRRYFQLIRPRE